jgi:hypothetical protein
MTDFARVVERGMSVSGDAKGSSMRRVIDDRALPFSLRV